MDGNQPPHPEWALGEAEQAETPTHCPYCGEPILLLVDPSVPHQVYVEDCPVCCQPMAVRAEVDADGDVRVDARREDDG